MTFQVIVGWFVSQVELMGAVAMIASGDGKKEQVDRVIIRGLVSVRKEWVPEQGVIGTLKFSM
jgi:hypothetical protein